MQEFSNDIRFLIKNLPESIDRLNARSGDKTALSISLIGQQLANSLVQSFSSNDISGVLLELGKILDENKLGEIKKTDDDPLSFELIGCIGCEDGTSQGDSLRCQLLTRIFETILEESLNIKCIVKWIKSTERIGKSFDCTFKINKI